MSRSPSAGARKLAAAAPVFAALGDETRLRLVARLSDGGPRSTRQLTDETSVSRQAITKHLVALAEAGLVSDTRSGRERLWRLEPRGLDEARRCLDHISRQWDDAIERLRSLVEPPPSG